MGSVFSFLGSSKTDNGEITVNINLNLTLKLDQDGTLSLAISEDNTNLKKETKDFMSKMIPDLGEMQIIDFGKKHKNN